MQKSQSSNAIRTYSIILVVLLFAAVIIIGIMASVPPVSRDALIHHLAIPKLYLEHGGIYEIPAFGFSYYPMNVTLLYAIPLYFGSDILPKFIHFAFAIGTAFLIYRYLIRRLSKEYALIGALFFLTIPVIVRLSTTAYVDLGLIFFLFASILFLFNWIESRFKIRYLLLSAVFCGLALGTKYNGLVGLFLLGLFVPFVYSRYTMDEKKRINSAKAIGYAFVFVAVSLAVFSPWMIRNAMWTGNPVYPLYDGVFNPATPSVEPSGEAGEELSRGMNHFQVRRDVYGESTLEIALIPIRVFFQGQDDNPKYFDGRLNPFLFFLAIFSLFGLRGQTRQLKTEKLMLLFFSILFLLISCAQTSIRIRYFSPIIPPLVILSMYGLHALHEKAKDFKPLSTRLKKFCIFAVVFVMLSLNGLYSISLFQDIKPFEFITGKVSRDEYIQHFRPEYASMQYANQNLSGEDKILGVFLGNRGYYSDIEIGFTIDKLQKFAAVAKHPSNIAEMLRDEGFSHLLINYDLFNTYAANYSNHEKRILASFFDEYTHTEFAKDGNGLMRILHPPNDQQTLQRNG